jgi:hypothetical protein
MTSAVIPANHCSGAKQQCWLSCKGQTSVIYAVIPEGFYRGQTTLGVLLATARTAPVGTSHAHGHLTACSQAVGLHGFGVVTCDARGRSGCRARC